MTYNVNFDQYLSTETDLSTKATLVFDILYKARGWAKIIKIDDKEYRLMYRQKILDELPRCKISLRTLSNLLTELKTKKLIEVVNENSSPAYCITDYALSILDNKNRGKKDSPQAKNDKQL